MSAHVHAESMRLYAEDAAETDKPWRRWETSAYRGAWDQCHCHPQWDLCVHYRRKPRTININGIEVPEPLREAPKHNEWFYHASITERSFCAEDQWIGSMGNKNKFNRGLIHSTGKAAEIHGRALASFTGVSDG